MGRKGSSAVGAEVWNVQVESSVSPGRRAVCLQVKT